MSDYNPNLPDDELDDLRGTDGDFYDDLEDNLPEYDSDGDDGSYDESPSLRQGAGDLPHGSLSQPPRSGLPGMIGSQSGIPPNQQPRPNVPANPGGTQPLSQPPRPNLPGQQSGTPGQQSRPNVPAGPGGTQPLGQPPRPNMPGQQSGTLPSQQPRPNVPASPGGTQPPGQPPRPNLPGQQGGTYAQGQSPRPNPPGVTGQSAGAQSGQQQRLNLPGTPSGAQSPGQYPRPDLPGITGQQGGNLPDQRSASNLPGGPVTTQGQGQPPRPGLPGQSGGIPSGQQRPNVPGSGVQQSQPAKPNQPGATGQPGGAPPIQQPRPALPGSPSGGKPGLPSSPGAQPQRPTSGATTAPGQQTSPGAAGSAQAGVRPQPSAPVAPPAPRKRGTQAKASAPGRRTLPSVEGISIRERVPVDPNAPPEPHWIQRIQSMLPSFSDEVTALVLIALGLLSFFTLFSPQSGELGAALAHFLAQTFGWGAFVVAGAILAAGMILLAPKVNIDVPINWWRIIWAEVFFVITLAFIHGLLRLGYSSDLAREEAVALALEGQGGGFIGWAVQELLSVFVGDLIADFLLLLLMAVTGALAFGITREHVMAILAGLEKRFFAFAYRMEGRVYQKPRSDEVPKPASEVAVSPSPSREIHPAPPVVGPDGTAIVELPAIPGRPSIITGETGAGAATTTRFEPGPARIANLRRKLAEEGIENIPEIKYRFSLKEAPDKKKFKKRSPDGPPIEILDSIDYARPEEDEININAQIIEETVEDFGMKVEVVGVRAGPTVTQYAVQPFSEVEQDGKKVVTRVRVTRVAALAQDLSLSLAAPRVRIQAPVPGTNYIGVEVPNSRPGIVSLRPVIESERFFKIRSPLTIALGRDVGGKPFAADLTSMPHLLIGGTTGSGKSVCLSALTTCLVFNNRPDELRLIMIDPKMVELIRFNGLPHLLGHVEVELERIIGVLRWVTREMDRRYKLMEEAQARNILVFNQIKKKKDRLPYIVVLVDELAELMTEYHDETEHLLTRLAQMARATGIHLVVATQRPSTDVVTGLIKANFPARIAFAVASSVDSRVIIDSVGAEDLIGRGDMLYYASDAAGPIRLQGCFVSDAELDRLVEYWRAHWKEDEEETEAPWERSLTRAAVLEETDQMLEEAIRIIQKEGEASASLLQRRLNVSYPRAGRIIDSLYKMGVVGEPQAGGRSRRLLIPPSLDATTYIVTWRQNHPDMK